MARLTDTQLVILNAAAQRDDRNVLPLPHSLKGGAAKKVIGSLLSRGLVDEHATDSLATANSALNDLWRNDDAGHAVQLAITTEGLAAIGVEAPVSAAETPSAETGTDMAAKAPKTREGTKQAKLIALLREGATIDEMVAETSWQSHTVRGAMAGALKKRLGLTITSDKAERGRVYRIVD